MVNTGGNKTPEYYLDIETNARGQKPDIENDEILTIQFQKLSTRSGRKEGDLTILKSWESSEEKILKEFYSIFRPTSPFELIFSSDIVLVEWFHLNLVRVEIHNYLVQNLNRL